jgi:four helix bundle protein
MPFEHSRLEVYRVAVEFLSLADELAASLPRGRAYLADQLRRAAISIQLNIAEGAGEFAPAEKARFYRMARRSATECAAIVDACTSLRLTSDPVDEKIQSLLQRIFSMLTAMILRHTTDPAESDPTPVRVRVRDRDP